MMFKTSTSCLKFGLWSSKFIGKFDFPLIFYFDRFILTLANFEIGTWWRYLRKSEIKFISITLIIIVTSRWADLFNIWLILIWNCEIVITYFSFIFVSWKVCIRGIWIFWCNLEKTRYIGFWDILIACFMIKYACWWFSNCFVQLNIWLLIFSFSFTFYSNKKTHRKFFYIYFHCVRYLWMEMLLPFPQRSALYWSSSERLCTFYWCAENRNHRMNR